MPAESAPPADYTFASDNAAGIVPEALAALNAANAGGAPSYGDDPWSERARREISRIFATECEVFFVFNGTAANSLALAQFCRSHHSIICHGMAHVDTDECGAPEFFTGGSKVIAVGGSSTRLRPEDIAPVFGRGHGVHYPKPGAISLTQATELGTVYPPAEIRAISALAREHGLALHMDGARFANAAAALARSGHAPADLTWRAGVDVLSFGGTKNGLATTEAVVFFDPAKAQDFTYRVKQSGQLAAKQRFASAQWCGLLESGAWLKHAAQANAMAQALAAALGRFPALRLIAPVEANAVFCEFPPALVQGLQGRGWRFYRFVGEHGYRLMCSWATRPADIERFAADIAALGGG